MLKTVNEQHETEMTLLQKFVKRVQLEREAYPAGIEGYRDARQVVIDNDHAEALETHAWLLEREHVAAGGITPVSVMNALMQRRHGDAIYILCDIRKSDFREDVKPEPRTWSLPAEPGPEVKAVKIPSGVVFVRGLSGWFDTVGHAYFRWGALLDHGPLSDATDEIE